MEMSAAEGDGLPILLLHRGVSGDITQVMAIPSKVAAVADGRTVPDDAGDAAGAVDEGCSLGKGRGHYKLIAILRHPDGAGAVAGSHPPKGRAMDAAAGAWGTAAAAAGGGDSAALGSRRTRRKVFGMGTTFVLTAAESCKEWENVKRIREID